MKTLSPKTIAARVKKAKALDDRINKTNAANHEKLAFGIAKLIADHTRVEWEIVSNYLRRNNEYLISEEVIDKHPVISQWQAELELQKIAQKKADRKSRSATKAGAHD